ncbi:DUF6993 domain-containing protein [Microterricola viridarii]|uniref:DUF6993 domain-containing protein n=1 Tax=Microterricola viridarii TaxID=412690 RepID=A0A0X8E0V3_9MICO|nr:hypothetical protein [Microterricola viridarii]AMB58261.1 hypothetical protein AWU67_04670 [Microterricola viridarii]
MPRLLLSAVAVSAMLALAACTTPAPAPTVPPTASATPSATETPAPPPVLLPEGSAADNLAYFDSIAGSVLAANPSAGGEAFINALVAGGFDKAAMEVGFDRTSVDLAADSVPWSVRFNGDCLLGQFGPASGGYHSAVTPILSTGTCLIGATRPIDW